jgi:hypothetical protein
MLVASNTTSTLFRTARTNGSSRVIVPRSIGGQGGLSLPTVEGSRTRT